MRELLPAQGKHLKQTHNPPFINELTPPHSESAEGGGGVLTVAQLIQLVYHYSGRYVREPLHTGSIHRLPVDDIRLLCANWSKFNMPNADCALSVCCQKHNQATAEINFTDRLKPLSSSCGKLGPNNYIFTLFLFIFMPFPNVQSRVSTFF